MQIIRQNKQTETNFCYKSYICYGLVLINFDTLLYYDYREITTDFIHYRKKIATFPAG